MAGQVGEKSVKNSCDIADPTSHLQPYLLFQVKLHPRVHYFMSAVILHEAHIMLPKVITPALYIALTCCGIKPQVTSEKQSIS